MEMVGKSYAALIQRIDKNKKSSRPKTAVTTTGSRGSKDWRYWNFDNFLLSLGCAAATVHLPLVPNSYYGRTEPRFSKDRLIARECGEDRDGGSLARSSVHIGCVDY